MKGLLRVEAWTAEGFYHGFLRRFVPVCLAFLLVPSVQAAPLIDGVQEYQVFPYEGYEAEVPFRFMGNGEVTAVIVRDWDEKVVAGGTWNVVSGAPDIQKPDKDPLKAVKTSSHDLVIPNVPIGGEYTLKVTAGEESQSIEHILVGELWVVGGGSNALPGPVRRKPKNVTHVHFLTDGRWRKGIAPMFRPMPGEIPNNEYPMTAWLRAAQDYYNEQGIPVGLMGIARGRATMDSFWNASGSEMPEFKDLIEAYGQKASAFIWYQGEEDANRAALAKYERLLREMPNAVRRYTDNPELLFVVVQLARHTGPNQPRPHIGRVRDIQRRVVMDDDRSLLLATLGYPLRDDRHLEEQGIFRLGSRIAEAIVETKTNKGVPQWQGPRIDEAHFADASRRRIFVFFDPVDRLILGNNAHEDWLVRDDRHLGYPEPGEPAIESGILSIQIDGARVRRAGGMGTQTVQLELADTGYIEVIRVSRRSDHSLVLDLASEAGRDTVISYGLMGDDMGTLSFDGGKLTAAFDGVPVGEPKAVEPGR